MRDDFFQQRVDTVAINGTVTWKNDGAVVHTTTSDAGTWDSSTVHPGDTFARQFTQAGSFPYHCAFHGAPGTGMSGTIVVR
jgi:plastocyanin